MIYKQKKTILFSSTRLFYLFYMRDYWNCSFLYLIYWYNNINYNNIYMSTTETSITINNN